MTDPKRLRRLVDSLRFPPSVAETLVDAPCEPGEKLESADRPARGQELTNPAANHVPWVGLMAFDAAGEVRHLVSTIVEGKRPCVFIEIEVGGIGGRMLEAYNALEPQLF